MPYSYGKGKAKGKNQSAVVRRSLPVVLGGVGVASGVYCAISFKNVADASRAFDAETNLDTQAEIRDRQQRALVSGIITGGLTAVCLPVSAVLFAKNNKAHKKQAALSVIPGIAGHYGAALSIRF
jgi:hypothetical protein